MSDVVLQAVGLRKSYAQVDEGEAVHKGDGYCIAVDDDPDSEDD